MRERELEHLCDLEIEKDWQRRFERYALMRHAIHNNTVDH